MTRTWTCLLVVALAAVACGGTAVEVGEPTETLTAVLLTPSPTVSPTEGPTPSPSPSPSPSPPAPSPTPSPSPSPAASPPQPVPGTLKADDSGGTFRLRVGTTLTVRLGEEGMVWSDLSHTGDAVTVQERLFLIDPGYREWEVQGVKPGESVLTATGDPPCRNETPPCAAPSRLFEVTVVVES